MNADTNGQPVKYRVIVSRLLQQLLMALHHQEAVKGKGHQFIENLRVIFQRLEANPVEFGEPLYPLPALRLVVYQAAKGSLVVDYGVHQDKPIVFIRGFKLLGE